MAQTERGTTKIDFFTEFKLKARSINQSNGIYHQTILHLVSEFRTSNIDQIVGNTNNYGQTNCMKANTKYPGSALLDIDKFIK